MGEVSGGLPLISFITPMRNAQAYLDEMLESVVAQSYEGPMELCVYDDGSTDESRNILENWRARLEERGVALIITSSPPGAPAGGCGKGRNVAVGSSHGSYLCFLDADDVMMAGRVVEQLSVATSTSCPATALVGCRVTRGEDATPRWTHWLNNMTQEQLYLQRLKETTICQPTWFCARSVFDKVGGYVEDHPNQAEDLIFLYRHLELGGTLVRADSVLLMYRFHAGSVTGQRAVSKELIWSLRVAELEKVLKESPWKEGFTIWNAGKEGRRLFKSLSPESQKKLVAFCDVDPKKLSQGEYHAYPSTRKIPIVHFSKAAPPLLLCVKGDLTNGEFESNLESLNLIEGKGYLHFS